MLFKLWFYCGIAFWGVGLAFVRGWSLALPHLVVLYAAIGYFLATRGPSFEYESKSQQLVDYLTQLSLNVKATQTEIA